MSFVSNFLYGTPEVSTTKHQKMFNLHLLSWAKVDPQATYVKFSDPTTPGEAQHIISYRNGKVNLTNNELIYDGKYLADGSKNKKMGSRQTTRVEAIKRVTNDTTGIYNDFIGAAGLYVECEDTEYFTAADLRQLADEAISAFKTMSDEDLIASVKRGALTPSSDV